MFSILNNAVKVFLLFVIRCYRRYFSPALPANCRFYPTCSQYALEAIVRYGPYKGLFLSFIRIMKCHPFHPGGIDPVK